jgi:transposase
VADLFDRPVGGRPGHRSATPDGGRDAIHRPDRIQWRYLPERYGAWTAVWAQWRRWRANGVWAAAMGRLVAVVR